MQWAAYDAKDYLPKKPEGKSLFWPILALVFCILFLAAGAFAVKLTEDDVTSLEEPYIPHRVVGAIDHNPEEGVKLLDVKK